MRHTIWPRVLGILCLAGMLAMTGCEDDDDTHPPANISGAWSCIFSRTGEASLQETWTFNQSGTSVSGLYTFEMNSWAFTGAYVNGEFNGVDGDNWTIYLEFDGNYADGTISGAGETWQARLTRL